MKVLLIEFKYCSTQHDKLAFQIDKVIMGFPGNKHRTTLTKNITFR